jgi:hypothetical protein
MPIPLESVSWNSDDSDRTTGNLEVMAPFQRRLQIDREIARE